MPTTVILQTLATVAYVPMASLPTLPNILRPCLTISARNTTPIVKQTVGMTTPALLRAFKITLVVLQIPQG